MNLLIVDDEIIAIQGLLEDIQKDALGLDEIWTAGGYTEAMNIFLGHRVDILLCDIEMPMGSGLDLVEWVKKRYPECECIFLTCHDEFSFARQAIKLQCLDYILKPATADLVNETIQKAIEHITARQKEQVYKEYGKIYFNTISEPEPATEPDSKTAVTQVEDYIAMNIDSELTVEELANMVYLSAAHLSRLFKKKHNMTVNDYITSQRMKVAKELLDTTNLSVTMVSAKSGYSNYSYFIKMFKKTYGKTPRVYREELAQLKNGFS